MADVKISALPASTTPLAGTEVLPIVQSSTTRQVSVANLTAGRAVNALSITASSLTSGRVTYAGASGLLSDSANLTFDGTTLSTVGITTTGNTILGNASSDTLNVGNGDLIKDASGNLGLGVTPSAWRTDFNARALQLNNASFATFNDDSLYVAQNGYLSSTGWRYQSTRAASTYGQSAGTHFWNIAASGTAGNVISFTQAMTLDASGNLLVGTTTTRTNAGDVQVSKGISFPATQSAQTDANTLDDYEEGTWTPVLAGSTSTAGQSYAVQAGRYTKIGNICIAFFDAELTNAGVLVGNAQINGLPFSSANTGDISQGSGSISLFSSLATSLVSAIIGPEPNNNWINLRGLTAASGSTTNSFVATTFFTSSSRLSGTIIYQVA